MLTLVSLFAVLLFGTTASVSAVCGGDKPLSLCCIGLAPYSSNSGVWGGICGYYPMNPSELIGGRCIYLSSESCPTGSIATCCASTWPGPSGECALGTGCGTPSTPSTPSFTPAPIPDGWTLTSSCAQDDGSRVLYNDVILELSNNTPANCIAHCTAGGYSFAGVEYGTECHCGTGFVPGTPDNIAQSQCNVPCSGDSRYSCGGSWAIQLYTGPMPTETLPDGWSLIRFCGVDEANRVIENDNTTILSDNTPATCIEHCISLGFDYAGVEYGDECHCGTGYTGGAQAPTTDCNIPCAGDPGLTCGGSWRIQIYSSELQSS